MRYESAKLGSIEYGEDQVIAFIEGILGFPAYRDYVLLEHKKGPFLWLQSLEEPSLAFLVTDPWNFFPDYSPEIPDEDVEALELEEPYNFSVFCFVTVPERVELTTVNLKGPTVVNLNTRKAKQVVLLNPEYTTRHRLFGPAGEEAGGGAGRA
ncbi:MAG: flagellar assembly protein FliW [Actinobacteria bacterium]|nr:flagellar assembly protein FliW [Actinomycetota bacterium]